jgi:dsRNA-specific ribonuclease
LSNPVNEVKDHYSHNHGYYYETQKKLESLGDTALEIVLKEIHNKALKKASTDDAPN